MERRTSEGGRRLIARVSITSIPAQWFDPVGRRRLGGRVEWWIRHNVRARNFSQSVTAGLVERFQRGLIDLWTC